MNGAERGAVRCILSSTGTVRSPSQRAGVVCYEDQSEKATASVASHPSSDLRVERAANLASYSRQSGVKAMGPPTAVTAKCDCVPPKCDVVPLGQGFCSVRSFSVLRDMKPSPEGGGDSTFVFTVRISLCLWGAVSRSLCFPFQSRFCPDVRRRHQIPAGVGNPTYSFFLAVL